MTTEYDLISAFAKAIKAPTLIPIPGAYHESDDDFRKRVQAGCRISICDLRGVDLDALGKMHGLLRGGFQEVS